MNPYVRLLALLFAGCVAAWGCDAATPAREEWKISGNFVYASDMDSGTYMIIAVNASDRAQNPLIIKYKDINARNVEKLSEIIGLQAPEADPSTDDFCKSYEGTAEFIISDLKVEKRSVYGEETETEKVLYGSVKSASSVKLIRQECSKSKVSKVLRSSSAATPQKGGFANVIDAAKSLGFETDEAKVDLRKGLLEVDASSQVFLPPGSNDVVITYKENNRGTPLLAVYRYANSQWKSVGSSMLPNFGSSENSSRYSLEFYNVSKVFIRNVETKKAYIFSNGRFEAE